MSASFTTVDWALCGTAVLIIMLAIYTHAEGNRFSAIKFAYDDISREMRGHSRLKVWLRAINIAMGWQSKRDAAPSRPVTPLRKTSVS